MFRKERAGSGLLTVLLFLVLPLALIFALNARVDLVKPYGFDEMIVSRVALQPDLSALWKILASGQSPHPPLNFLAVRATYGLLGVNEFTTRLPATLGVTVMEICLFFFVSKRSNAAFGTVAMIFPLITLTRWYAVEAKPYGALLGWTGAALICWRYAARGNRYRGWALAGLGIALACATSSHFFGALVSVPIIAGEAVRLWQRRHIDWIMAAVLTLNYWPLFFFVPILKAGSQVHGVHPWQRPLGMNFVLASGDLLLAKSAAPILVCVLAAMGLRAFGRSSDFVEVRFPLDEIAAAAALALLPLAAFCGLRLAGIKVIEEKYVINMVAGLAILFAWSLYRFAEGSIKAGILLAAIVALWAIRDFDRDLRVARMERADAVNFSPPAVANPLGPLPIVIDPVAFTAFETYAAPPISERIFVLVDPEMRFKYAGTDATDRSILLNPAFFGRHVEPRGMFEAVHRKFLLYEKISLFPNWMLQKFVDDGAKIELIRGGPEDRWYVITL